MASWNLGGPVCLAGVPWQPPTSSMLRELVLVPGVHRNTRILQTMVSLPPFLRPQKQDVVSLRLCGLWGLSSWCIYPRCTELGPETGGRSGRFLQHPKAPSIFTKHIHRLHSRHIGARIMAQVYYAILLITEVLHDLYIKICQNLRNPGSIVHFR